eukprot:GABV01009650.1.p2 GENE.GABV01009650.1~~GABV01009650.1.p2  ORF type:complete len:109 (+),score=12.13 GABV01009650.1:92-418(+)
MVFTTHGLVVSMNSGDAVTPCSPLLVTKNLPNSAAPRDMEINIDPPSSLWIPIFVLRRSQSQYSFCAILLRACVLPFRQKGRCGRRHRAELILTSFFAWWTPGWHRRL